MKKMPTLFERDWNGDRSRVVDQVHLGCEWVLAGEGVATRKLDGTCCMVRDGKLYKRREVRENESAPAGFQIADIDGETGKTVGWLPVGDGPDDRWHREALALWERLNDGTYELVGPKVQGNPERFPEHQLVQHGLYVEDEVPRTFSGLKDWLAGADMEGIVWHHPDGRMAKIKLRDFGLKRAISAQSAPSPTESPSNKDNLAQNATRNTHHESHAMNAYTPIHEVDALRAEIARLTGLLGEWENHAGPYKDAEIKRLQTGWDLATKAVDTNERLRAACERMMIGGNHIATYHTERWPDYGSEPMDALEKLGAGQEYDMWCCWNAIMCARDTLKDTLDASNAIDPLDQSPLARWAEAEGGFNIIVDERWGAFFPKDSEEQVKLLVESVNRVFNESR